MANEEKDIKLISRNQSGFPDWLDFNKLRAEGIDHIGQLAGRIWTDHNVHDPGITTLEILCYALMDLGYRTNLPAKDIFSRNPEDATVDDNFFTPAEILSVNPLTIMDYRKLLIDIPGVKNAWLEIATDRHADDICDRKVKAYNDYSGWYQQPDPCCDSYLNGLYHVYIDTENDLNDPASIRRRERECLLDKIKRSLMTHRNICEDFLDVMFLCKWKIGVCADIELDDHADPEKVYLDMIEKLRQFFSPSPKFYTLAQMLDKKKSMDEIFAGRPLDSRDSHGFVDTEELEKIDLKKTIHVSDVYNILFSVPGIRNVKRLQLVDCKKQGKLPEWVVKVPENNVPDFSIECSGFAFRRNGIPVSFDFKKYEALLEINFEHNGKILYSWPSTKLDAEIPKGIYHKSLGAYSSIQNEFPRVYGIAEGGLPDNVSPERKAQALQFKGYLLFFDQLLANYLSQLQNMRSLFSIRENKNKKAKRGTTYFSSLPGEVPDFQQLVRYQISESAGETIGETGYLAFPVGRKYFRDILEQQQQHCISIEDLPLYRFSTATEKDIAVAQLQDDMHNENFEIHYVTRPDDCVFYYLTSSSEDFVLVSRKYYADEKSAMLAASSIRYAGTILNNYHSSHLELNKGHSFRVELNVTGYSGFLQQLTEDDTLYHQRRQGFLDHLLARFAENFSDYALLSYSFYSGEELQKKNTEARESYLSNYPLLSSNRGKAFDYTTNGWHNDNNSGYEKKIRALLGSRETGRNSLCNFEVYDYGEKYVFQLKLASSVIRAEDKFNTREEALHAARRLFDALGLQSSYHVATIPYQQQARIYIHYGAHQPAEVDISFPTINDAEKAAGYLHRMVAMPPANGNVEVVDYLYAASLMDSDGFMVRKLQVPLHTEEQVMSSARKVLNKVNDDKVWDQTGRSIGKLAINPSTPAKNLLIDESFFKTDVSDNIIGNPDLHRFDLLDKGNHFLFTSLEHYRDPKKAKEECVHAIRLLSLKDNLTVRSLNDSQDEKQTGAREAWSVFISEQDREIAQCSKVVASRKEAEDLREDIWLHIVPSVFYLQAEAKPYTYKFNYRFGYEEGRELTMQSSQDYFSRGEAEMALADFSNSIERTFIHRSGNDWQLIAAAEGNRKMVLGHFPGSNDQQIEEANHWLEVQKAIHRIKESGVDEKILSSYVDVREDNKCHYTYQLVDKDGVYAVTKIRFKTKEDAKNGLVTAFNASSALFDILELQMAGHVSEYIMPVSKVKWYHYRLMSHNLIPDPKGGQARKLVLFESIRGYHTKEDAEKAFAAEFMMVLSFAGDPLNYGVEKTISEKEIFNCDETGCGRSVSMVFVPDETLTYLGAYPQQAIMELARIIRTYPVKSIQKNGQSELFKELFHPCEIETPDACKPKAVTVCKAEEEKPVYYFSLFDKQADDVAWQGLQYYQTAAEAMEAFRFFLFLLKDPLNFTVSQDCKGTFGLYIREVLAESFSRFESKKLAWGSRGVQKFTAVSQQPYSFHPYTDKNCCFRFFVACRNKRVFHPCTYDSPEVRDRVMDQLRHYLPGILNWKFSFCRGQWNGLLSDFEGNDVARVESTANWDTSTVFDAYIGLFSLLGNHCLHVNDQEGYLILDIEEKVWVKFFPLQPGQDLKLLKEKIEWLSCYFPFSRKTNNRDQGEYCIEIRLPGFNICDPCDDGTELCPVAWASDCCFSTCMEMLNAYYQIISWLGRSQYYKPVFDCPCGSYGIELYNDETECIGENDIPGQYPFALQKIIAVSPLCYPSAEMVCAAIERAKQLINTEGLHLVEHILLRPHCPEHCNCIIQPCNDHRQDDCKFPYWTVDNDDPCDETRPVCFEPGSDPYSFIATAVLPAWPERFRNPANKELLKNMLQREMPAHVLLRITWMTPHDMCCFETRYRKWLMWSAYKDLKTESSAHCDLVRFLFNREFECLDNEQPCDDCGRDVRDDKNCVEEMQKQERMLLMEHANRLGRKLQPKEKSWEEHINDLFCWPYENCDKGFYLECEESERELVQIKTLHERSGETLTGAVPVPERKQDQTRFLNSRRTSRKKILNTLVEKAGEQELTVRTMRLLESPSPSFDLYHKLVKDIVALKKKKKKATEIPAKELILIATHSYLDNLVSTGDVEKLASLGQAVELLRRGGYQPVDIYRAWKPDKMAEYITVDYITQIEKLFT